MATTGIVLGRNWLFLSNAVQIDHLTSVSLDTGSETIDLTSYDSAGWKDIAIGDQSWSISIEGHVAFDATEGYDTMMADKIAKTAVACLLSTASSGDSTLSGSSYITSLSIKGDLGSSLKISATFSGNGPLAAGTVA